MLVLDWLRRLTGSGGRTASKQQGDVQALNTPDDPRGGEQKPEYRHGRPTDVVEEGGTTMMGPGGSPPAEESPDERRSEQRGEPS